MIDEFGLSCCEMTVFGLSGVLDLRFSFREVGDQRDLGLKELQTSRSVHLLHDRLNDPAVDLKLLFVRKELSLGLLDPAGHAEDLGRQACPRRAGRCR